MKLVRTLSGMGAWALLAAGSDQVIKELVLRKLAPGEFFAVVPGVVSITHRHNPGAAFSLLQHAPIGALILLNLVVLAVLLVVVRPYLHTRMGMIATVCILGGALGNLIDRLRWHYVIDFLEVRLTPTYIWPTFNLADAYIVTGVLLLGLVVWHQERISPVLPPPDSLPDPAPQEELP